jgi:hypothetical protein
MRAARALRAIEVTRSRYRLYLNSFNKKNPAS